MCLNECEEKNMEAASVKRVWAGILAVGILLGMSGCAANKEGAVKEMGKLPEWRKYFVWEAKPHIHLFI